MTRSDRIVVIVSAVLVLLLGATSAFFFIAKPLSAPTSSSSSRDDDEDDEPAEEEPEEDPAPEFTLADLESLAYSADLSDLGVSGSPNQFSIATSAESLLGSWAAGPDAADSCYGIYAASGLLGEDDTPGSTEMAVGIAGSTDIADFLTEGYVGTFGRVLDSEDDALDLIAEFEQAAEDCDSGFAVTRADGLLSVVATDYSPARIDVPDDVSAYTIEYEMDGGDFVAFRVHILQRGNALIASFAIVKSASSFDETAADGVAEAIAAELAEL